MVSDSKVSQNKKESKKSLAKFVSKMSQDGAMNVQESDDSKNSVNSIDALGVNLKKLLALGKSQGFLTYDQINQHIDSDAIDAKRLEKIFDVFAEFKIKIVEKEEDPIEKQNKEVMEKDYEASFPGLDK